MPSFLRVAPVTSGSITGLVRRPTAPLADRAMAELQPDRCQEKLVNLIGAKVKVGALPIIMIHVMGVDRCASQGGILLNMYAQ